MNEFEKTLIKFREEADEIQKVELDFQMRAKFFNEKWHAFLKENGLPENFTMPGMVLLAIRKTREPASPTADSTLTVQDAQLVPAAAT